MDAGEQRETAQHGSGLLHGAGRWTVGVVRAAGRVAAR